MKWLRMEPGFIIGAMPNRRVQVVFAGRLEAEAEYLSSHGVVSAMARQVHGATVTWVGVHGSENAVAGCDGLATSYPRVGLTVRTADCIPLLISGHGGVAAVHLGWRGLRSGLVTRVLHSLEWYGGEAISGLRFFVGPSIRACCYKVGSEFNTYFDGFVNSRSGSLYCDLVGVLRAQLQSNGIESNSLLDCAVCTHCAEGWHSYRREASVSDRNRSVVWVG